MDEDPGFIDTPSRYEKAVLYGKVQELLNSDSAQYYQMDTDDNRDPVYGLLLDGEADVDGDLYRMGYITYVVQYTEEYVKRQRTYPGTYLVKAYRQVGQDASEYRLFEENGVPEILPHLPPQGLKVSDSLAPPTPITKEQGLDLRAILMSIEKEL